MLINDWLIITEFHACINSALNYRCDDFMNNFILCFCSDDSSMCYDVDLYHSCQTTRLHYKYY